jgi:hypothetical protein
MFMWAGEIVARQLLEPLLAKLDHRGKKKTKTTTPWLTAQISNKASHYKAASLPQFLLTLQKVRNHSCTLVIELQSNLILI